MVVIPKVDTGEVTGRHPFVNSKFNVRRDTTGQGDHLVGDLQKIPCDTWVNCRAFSYKVKARVVNGTRVAEYGPFHYRFDGESHRGGRIK